MAKPRSVFIQTAKNITNVIPMIAGMLLVISIIDVTVPPDWYTRIFTGNELIDSFIGASVGSISVGHPITSYIIGGELLDRGMSLVAVLAFLLSWVTVGIIQLPIEGSMLGWRFALVRNSINFILAVTLSIIISLTLGLL